ncbi:hypothetical protein HerbRD11066_08480 [Herbidospora sp. RD11066]
MVDLLLAEASRLIDDYRIPEAEKLLDVLAGNPAAMAALPPGQRCRLLLEWGWIHGATQRYPSAREALGRAVAIAETISPRDLLGEALRESGIVAKYEGDFARADTLLERAERVAREDGNRLGQGQALFLRAAVAHLAFEFVRCRALLTEAVEIADALDDHVRVVQLRADIRRELAVSSRMARDFDASRRHLTEALAGYTSIGRRVGAANVQRELGATIAQTGHHLAARPHYAAAFAGYLRAGRRQGAALVARRLGQLDVQPGDDLAERRRTARRRFDQALRLGAGDPANRVVTTVSLAMVARMDGRLDEAAALLEDAVAQYDAMELGPAVTRGLSQILLESGQIAVARGDEDEALTCFRQAVDLLPEQDDPSAASLAHYHLATALIRADQVEEATRHALAGFALNEADGRRLTDPGERRVFYESTRDSYGLALHCATRADDGLAALTVATAARSEALAAFVRAGARFTPHLDDLIQRITLTAAEADAVDSARARLTELYAQLERETSRQMRLSIAGENDVQEMIKALPSGGHALILDVLEEDVSYCTRIWVDPAREIRVDQVVIPGQVREFLNYYHQAAPRVAWRSQHDDLAAVGRTLMPPGLAEALSGADAPPLIVSTGSVLGPLPIAAVVVAGRHLVELAQLAVVPSLALWPALRARPRRGGSGVLAYLDPAIAGYQRERDALVKAFAPVDFATADTLPGLLTDAGRYAAVVVTAHGIEPARPAEGAEWGDRGTHAGLGQGLHLGEDRQLTAAHLLRCRLPEGFITPSCWSGRLGVRTAVEPLGLPAAALLAGARWVLAGTVDIHSTATARLLSAFYGRLATGETPAAALRQVQLDYLGRRSTAVPAAWAGLTLIGDGFTPVTT